MGHARGSNQYRSKGTSLSSKPRASSTVSAEQVAWVLNPEMDVWRDAGFDYPGYRQWVADGGTFEDVEEWHRRLSYMDGSLPYAGPVWYVVNTNDAGDWQVRVAADKDTAVAVLHDFVADGWGRATPKPQDERLAILRWYDKPEVGRYADVEQIPAQEFVDNDVQVLVIETRSSILYFAGSEDHVQDELRSYVAEWWAQEIPDEPQPEQIDDDAVDRYFELMCDRGETYLIQPCQVEHR